MRERDTEKYLSRRVKELGGECRKVQWIGRRGAPDRLVMLPPRVRNDWASRGFDDTHTPTTTPTIWVELKAPGGLATFPKNAHERKQYREHNRMRAMGQCVVVIDSIEGVEELLS